LASSAHACGKAQLSNAAAQAARAINLMTVTHVRWAQPHYCARTKHSSEAWEGSKQIQRRGKEPFPASAQLLFISKARKDSAKISAKNRGQNIA
jgi:hypothetical protein